MMQTSRLASDALLPRSSLRSAQARECLSRYVAEPFIKPGYKVSAFRMTWFNQSPDYLQGLWDRIVQLRDQFDEVVKGLPGVELCLSAITATSSALKKTQDPAERRIYPGLAYWVVSPMGEFSERIIYDIVNKHAAGANMKLLLQPHQVMQKDVCNALHTVVKDSMEGCVRRLVDASMYHCYGQGAGQGAIVKVHVVDSRHREALARAQVELCQVRFDFTLV